MTHEVKADPAAVSGQAGRISKAEKDALAAQSAVLRMTVEVTRAGTGKKEVFELIGTPVAEGEGPQGDIPSL